jgi:hypothetical protein
MIFLHNAGTRSVPRAAAILALVAALAALAVGCTYRGAIDQPITLKATWFSYLNGDDIRAACGPGAASRYRLVYNGHYDEQLRSYEVVGDGAGGAFYTVRVQTGGGIVLSRFSLRDPQAMAGWRRAEDRLSPADWAGLESALETSGGFGPAPTGLRLASEQFYWIASLCRGGQFHFNAWLYPSARFDGLSFPRVLLGHDGTGIAINPPREVAKIERVRKIIKDEGGPLGFDLEIGDNGFAGHMTLF